MDGSDLIYVNLLFYPTCSILISIIFYTLWSNYLPRDPLTDVMVKKPKLALVLSWVLMTLSMSPTYLLSKYFLVITLLILYNFINVYKRLLYNV